MVTEGQVSQAVRALRAPLGLETNARELDAMRPLFPQCDGDVTAPVKSPNDQLGLNVFTDALLPTGVGPGLDGSRFEFRKPTDDEDPSAAAVR